MSKTTILDLAHLAARVYHVGGGILMCDSRGWTLSRPLDEIEATGYAAAVYVREPDTVLAFRGTDGRRDFTHGNIGNSLLGFSSQALNAVASWKEVTNRTGGNFFMTGHSLGGALVAILSSMLLGSAPRAWFQRHHGAATFCAPGVDILSLFNLRGQIAANGLHYSTEDAPVFNIRVCGDLVSNLPGVTVGKERWIYVPPTSDRWFRDCYDRYHSIDALAASLATGKNIALGAMTVSEALSQAFV